VEFRIDGERRRSRTAAALTLFIGLVLAGCSANGGLGTGGSGGSSGGGSSGGGSSGGGGVGPTVTITATPGQVAPGGTITLTWSSSDPSATCTASSSAPSSTWQGTKPTSGTTQVIVPTTPGSYAYALTCKNAGGTGTGTATVQVGTAGSSPTVTIQASPAQVSPGGDITLTWSSSDPQATCTASSSDSASAWKGTQPTSGTTKVTAPQASGSYAYALSCTNANGTGTGTATVQVGGGGGPGTPPTVTITATPGQVAPGGQITLTWSSSDPNAACTASSSDSASAWKGTEPASGTTKIAASQTQGTYTYSLTCTNAAGSGVGTASVTVGTPPQPTVNITVSPPAIQAKQQGQQAELAVIQWSSTNATTCQASGGTGSDGWNGTTQPTSGSFNVSAPSTPGTYDYTLTCTGAGGSGSGTAVLTVTSGPAPTVQITPHSQSIPVGGSASFSWTSTNVSVCNASGAWSGQQPVNGSFNTGSLSTAGVYQYTLTCSGSAGSATDTATVTVGAPPPPTVTISVNPTSIQGGQSATLTWSSTNATSCTASGSWSGDRPVSGTASTGTLNTAGAYSYTLTCSGPSGSAADSALLTVTSNFVQAPDCGVGVPTVALVGSAAKATFSATSSCLACSVSNLGNVTDTDLTNFATISTTLNLIGSASINVTNGSVFPGGRKVGFLVSTPNALLLSLGLLQNVSLETFLAGQAQETATTSSPTISLDLLGLINNPNEYFLSFTTSAGKNFDAVQINDGGTLDLLSGLNVYAACVSTQ
jgi:hypothetical protein